MGTLEARRMVEKAAATARGGCAAIGMGVAALLPAGMLPGRGPSSSRRNTAAKEPRSLATCAVVEENSDAPPHEPSATTARRSHSSGSSSTRGVASDRVALNALPAAMPITKPLRALATRAVGDCDAERRASSMLTVE